MSDQDWLFPVTGDSADFAQGIKDYVNYVVTMENLTTAEGEALTNIPADHYLIPTEGIPNGIVARYEGTDPTEIAHFEDFPDDIAALYEGIDPAEITYLLDTQTLFLHPIWGEEGFPETYRQELLDCINEEYGTDLTFEHILKIEEEMASRVAPVDEKSQDLAHFETNEDFEMKMPLDHEGDLLAQTSGEEVAMTDIEPDYAFSGDLGELGEFVADNEIAANMMDALIETMKM